MKAAIIDLLEGAWGELLFATPFSRARCEQTLEALTQNPDGCILVHFNKQQQPVGVLLAARGQGLCFDGNAVEVFCWYIQKQARGSAGREMVKALEEWALRDGNTKQIAFCIGNEKTGNRTVKFLNRLGYQLAGSVVIKEV